MSTGAKPGPFPTLGESMVQRAIPIFQPILADLQNEAGQPRTVTVRSIYAYERAQWPLVTVRIILGDVHMTAGQNVLFTDEEQFRVVRGMRVPGTQLLLDVMARSDPERYYLVDVLQGALLASYVPLPGGQIIAGPIISQLRDIGLVVTAVRSPRFPEPNLSEVRPEGQTYYASLVIEADAWITWDTPAQAIDLREAPVFQHVETDPDRDDLVADAYSVYALRVPADPPIGPRSPFIPRDLPGM